MCPNEHTPAHLLINTSLLYIQNNQLNSNCINQYQFLQVLFSRVQLTPNVAFSRGNLCHVLWYETYILKIYKNIDDARNTFVVLQFCQSTQAHILKNYRL